MEQDVTKYNPQLAKNWIKTDIIYFETDRCNRWMELQREYFQLWKVMKKMNKIKKKNYSKS